MRHFFILGSNPVLSAAEIIALLDGRHFTVTEMYKQALIVDAAEGYELDAEGLMARLGGTIKIGKILEEEMPINAEKLEEKVLDGLSDRVTNVGNATFAISVYSLLKEQPTAHAATLWGKFRRVGMNVKKRLKAAGCAARWVAPKQGANLSSASVGNNRILEDGGEFVVFAKKDSMMLGKTTVIQPYEQFSNVDYGRPERDTVQGMLPPKLARIMINLIHVSREVADVALMDPFCGSGTVITEALRVGFRELYGSDKNPEAVKATLANIAWLKEQDLIHVENEHVSIVEADARSLKGHVKEGVLDAIVTEPYLGPPLRGREKRGELQKNLSELSRLYYDALAAWKPLLKPGSPVVMALPVFIYGMEKHGMQVKEFEALGYKPESLLPASILSRLGTRETKNKGLLYGRNEQRVWREIVRLRVE